MRWQGVSSTSDSRLAQMWALTGVLDGGSGSRALVVVVWCEERRLDCPESIETDLARVP